MSTAKLAVAPSHPGPWIDSHCHLDAPEFDPDRDDVVSRARAAGVGTLVMPGVHVRHFEDLRRLAHRHGLPYAIGIHPLWVRHSADDDLALLRATVVRWHDDPLLVAVGEIGLDHFVPSPDPAREQRFYVEQLKIARDAGLPVILHVRRSSDALLAGLRRVPVAGGIAHAFNGSEQQAGRFVDRGFRLGFGGALTFDTALHLRRLARSLPAEALVLETDAPDIPPHWIYRKAADRAAGAAQGRNEPAELPRIAAVLAELRGWTTARTAQVATANTLAALPRLAAAVRGTS